MNILLLTETLHPGGAETFVVRLANGLQAKGHKVWVFVIHPHKSKNAVVQKLASGITLVNFKRKYRPLKQKIDGLLFRLGVDFNLLQREVTRALARLIKKEALHVIHSHLFHADYFAACLSRKMLPAFRHVSTHHGDYLLFQSNRPYGIHNYPEKLALTVASLQGMAVISDVQYQQFEDLKKKYGSEIIIPKILNGYEEGLANAVPTKEDLGIKDGAFVIGMVARGIPEKGWEILINAFLRLNLPQSCLLLVGEGPEIERLCELHRHNPSIHFVGYTPDTIGFIRHFNIGVLPSYYKAESLPTVIIEYLYCGKPVVATDIGEVQRMLQADNAETAGLLIHMGDKQIMELELTAALRKLCEDHQLLEQLSANALLAFEKFSMDNCIVQYEALYSGNICNGSQYC